MGLLDGYFDPQQFQDSGGLLGRLLSLQQAQGMYQPGDGFEPQASASEPVPANASQATPQPPDLGDRLSAGFQSWAHTPVGKPFAALANGISGLSSGQRADPAGDPQQDLNSQYQALRPILGDHNAMLAIVYPEVGKTLITQALADPAKAGNIAGVNPAGNDQASPNYETTSTAGGQRLGNSPVIAESMPPRYATSPAVISRRNKPAALPRNPRVNFRRSDI